MGVGRGQEEERERRVVGTKEQGRKGRREAELGGEGPGEEDLWDTGGLSLLEPTTGQVVPESGWLAAQGTGLPGTGGARAALSEGPPWRPCPHALPPSTPILSLAAISQHFSSPLHGEIRGAGTWPQSPDTCRCTWLEQYWQMVVRLVAVVAAGTHWAGPHSQKPTPTTPSWRTATCPVGGVFHLPTLRLRPSGL